MTDRSLRYVAIQRSGSDENPIEIVVATPSGQLRPIPISETEALRLIEALASSVAVVQGRGIR